MAEGQDRNKIEREVEHVLRETAKKRESWEYDRLWAKKGELDVALAEKKIPLSQWYAAVDPILHRLPLVIADKAVPLHRFSAADIRELEGRPTPQPGPRPRVLVARRFGDARKEAKSLLENIGCEVATVGDGLEAFVELAFGRYDLLITGSVLSHLPGAELIRLKSLLRIGTPAIMHTLMPVQLAGGLALDVPLPPEDCICAGSLVGEKFHLTTKNIVDYDERLIARVKEHLARRKKG